MAWQLDIHVIDVGTGDSTLIVAQDAGGHDRSSLLIDAGLAQTARIVHDKIQAAALPNLDAILVSHYDIDHSMGITALLQADNLTRLSDIIAGVAVPAMPAGTDLQVIARAAARAMAAARGAWGTYAGQAGPPGDFAFNNVPAGTTPDAAAAFGAGIVKADYTGNVLVPAVITRRKAARAAGIAAQASLASHNPLATIQANVRTAMFTALQNNVMAGAKFETGGRYLTTRILDIGAAVAEPPYYSNAITGKVTFSNGTVQVPGVNRPRTSVPQLGSEVLWQPNHPPDLSAPVAIVISTPRNWGGEGSGWQGSLPPVKPVYFTGGTTGNCVSIGIVLAFDEFYYFTAGDLPSAGENPIGNAIMATDLPDGNGAWLPTPNVVNLRCSHHGASESTSDSFVARIKPLTALISCGDKHGHPTQEVIDTLEFGGVARFWLTNCRIQRDGVPFSFGLNQLTAANNRSLVSGDNNQDNMQIGRNRGDIHLSVTQAGASAAAGARSFDVTHWEQSLAVPGPFTSTMTW